VEGGLLLDVVVTQGAAVLKLLASEDEALLVRGNALLVCGVMLATKHARRATAGDKPWILDLTLSMVSLDSTSSVMVLPVRVLTKILRRLLVNMGRGAEAAVLTCMAAEVLCGCWM
jgi:hypothetical protein